MLKSVNETDSPYHVKTSETTRIASIASPTHASLRARERWSEPRSNARRMQCATAAHNSVTMTYPPSVSK